MTGTLRPQMPGRDGPELGVNQRQELFERAVIPLLPGPEILGDRFDSLMIQGMPAAGRESARLAILLADVPEGVVLDPPISQR
jgi:hypothetical protein